MKNIYIHMPVIVLQQRLWKYRATNKVNTKLETLEVYYTYSYSNEHSNSICSWKV